VGVLDALDDTHPAIGVFAGRQVVKHNREVVRVAADVLGRRPIHYRNATIATKDRLKELGPPAADRVGHNQHATTAGDVPEAVRCVPEVRALAREACPVRKDINFEAFRFRQPTEGHTVLLVAHFATGVSAREQPDGGFARSELVPRELGFLLELLSVPLGLLLLHPGQRINSVFAHEGCPRGRRGA
jgi:hypothetical protein